MLISPEYRLLNARLHQEKPEYGTSGHKMAVAVDLLAKRLRCQSVLDYGCGKGTLKATLDANAQGRLPYSVFEYDPAIPGKEDEPAPADLVACGDVLEHVEPDCLFAVLDDIAALARKAVFLAIATRKAGKILADGRNAHLIIEPASWWLPKLADRWAKYRFSGEDHELRFIGECL